ncbi:glucose dehydrogenase [FAD, quinone]-like [Uranotaenia lowii]|uniref:glucose dehydrogenase [FAD, quinone]-like n=1 Tax=Uranotaenia lowii TaxID=190385 RepID=UPI00247B095F|nr:glucose dehydrogenase [FAD, quinone]-like [Uranotaenia lowii]
MCNVLQITILLIVAILFKCATSWNPIETVFDELSIFVRNDSHKRIPDTVSFRKSYDFIVIGAGSAGAVIASRLSEIKGWSVLLLEAGKDENIFTDIPLAAASTAITGYNWGYRPEPMRNACRGLIDRRCIWPKGRGLGGTSLINFMVYTRGNQRDYDDWARAGNYGWSYREVLKYFKKSERVSIDWLKSSPYHSTNGSLDVEYSAYESPLLRSFIDAGQRLGYDENDPNGDVQLGFSRVQATLRNGRRCSTAKAFLRPASRRSNLSISMKSRVVRILIDPSTKVAYGVEFFKNKRRYAIRAKKEVILSAGTIASPQLLMLSGVGPKEHLREMGIPVIQDLRVGFNLQDHVTVTGLVFTVNQSITIRDKDLSSPLPALNYFLNGKGPYTIPGGALGLGFIKTPISFLPKDVPDIELVLGAGALNNVDAASLETIGGIPKEFHNFTYGSIAGVHAFSISPVLMRPKSRGRIMLKSVNPFEWPRMQGNFCDDYDDIVVLREGLKLAAAIGESKSFRQFGAKLHHQPFFGCEHLEFRSDEYWECCIRQMGSSLQHQAGTCKMGPRSDRFAVVNPQLQVHGIQGLRVADASILPVIPASHTNAVAIMVGEKLADMLKQFWAPENANGRKLKR